MLTDQIAILGQRLTNGIEGYGRFTRFCAAAWGWLIRAPGKWGRASLLVPQLFGIGTRSIPVIMVVGAFVGMVLAVEAYDQFAAIGQEIRLGGIINISVVKQIGPVLAAIMLAGRIGGSVSAELGTMQVTEQLDAMRAMGADPIAYLVVPRVVACVVMIPLLTIFSDLLGILGGFFMTCQIFGVNTHDYWRYSARFVGGYSIFTGITKSVVFGLMIGLISCYKGFHCKSGAAGVGRAATEAFVTSFLAIIVANFFLAKLLKDLYFLIWGRGGPTAFG